MCWSSLLHVECYESNPFSPLHWLHPLSEHLSARSCCIQKLFCPSSAIILMSSAEQMSVEEALEFGSQHS